MRRYGQGATEYLVLLAVVLVIALVGIALLGFFPGTASEAQATESKIYWQSQAPVAIVEGAGRNAHLQPSYSMPYLRLRNTGSYRIRITKFLSGSNQIIQYVDGATGTYYDLSGLLDLAPGEERTMGDSAYFPGLPSRNHVWFYTSGGPGPNDLSGATSVCALSPPLGYMVMPNFGFEYVQYVEGQQITKRETGTKPLIIKCQS